MKRKGLFDKWEPYTVLNWKRKPLQTFLSMDEAMMRADTLHEQYDRAYYVVNSRGNEIYEIGYY